MQIRNIRANQIWEFCDFRGKVVACSSDRLASRILFEDRNNNLFAGPIDWSDADRLGPLWKLIEDAASETVQVATLRMIAFIARHPLPDAEPISWKRLVDFLVEKAKREIDGRYWDLVGSSPTIPIWDYVDTYAAIKGIEPCSRQVFDNGSRRGFSASKEKSFLCVWDEINDLD